MTDTAAAFYDRPEWYDLLNRPGTEDEAWLLERIHEEHGNGGSDWLEPACGSGRFLAVLSRRGWRVTGYDLNEKMLAYARRRLPGAALLRADMRSFRRPAAFDFAFCLQSTFRHLLTEKDALAHLRATAASLRPGGLYVLGLDLADYAVTEDDEETFEAARGRRRALHVMVAVAPDRKRRRERIINLITLETEKGSELLESTYDLRSYDKAQLESLLRASPFALEAFYGSDGRREELTARTRDGFFVLKKK